MQAKLRWSWREERGAVGDEYTTGKLFQYWTTALLAAQSQTFGNFNCSENCSRERDIYCDISGFSCKMRKTVLWMEKGFAISIIYIEFVFTLLNLQNPSTTLYAIEHLKKHSIISQRTSCQISRRYIFNFSRQCDKLLWKHVWNFLIT